MRREEESEAEAEVEDGSAVTDLVAEGVGLLASIKELLTEIRDDIWRERQSQRNADARLWEELEEVKGQLSAPEIYRLASAQAFERYLEAARAEGIEDSAEETDEEDGKKKETKVVGRAGEDVGQK